MKENRTLVWVFIAGFSLVLIMLYSTENLQDISLPENRIDYTEVRTVETINIFEREAMAEFAAEMFEGQGIRSGLMNIENVGIDKETLGVDTEIVNYTEVVLDDGTIVKYIEPETDVVDMYNKITSNGLIVVIIEDTEGNQTIIKKGDPHFDEYKQTLLKEKRSIQTEKLTSLELLLSEANSMGGYDAFLVNSQNEYSKIRSAQVYFNEKKNYILMLSKDKTGVEYFLVDAGADMYFDHIYEFSSEFLEIRGFVTANELEHLMYSGFMEMVIEAQDEIELNFKGDRLILKKHE